MGGRLPGSHGVEAQHREVTPPPGAVETAERGDVSMSRKHKRHDHLPRVAGASAGTTAPRIDGDGLRLAGCIEGADPETGKLLP
jgi:hypothetical protein